MGIGMIREQFQRINFFPGGHRDIRIHKTVAVDTIEDATDTIEFGI
jgi:hypothetical protein